MLLHFFYRKPCCFYKVYVHSVPRYKTYKGRYIFEPDFTAISYIALNMHEICATAR